MGIILDLSAFSEETADIRMANGRVLHLKKPTQRLVIHMLQLRQVDEHSAPLEIMGALDRIAMEILNNNADGVTFGMDVVSEMETDAKTGILQAYSDWATQLQANPTSGRHSPQAKRRKTGKPSWPWRRTP